jgi:hypothetical protein
VTTTAGDCPQLLRLAAAHLNAAARHTEANACGDLTSPLARPGPDPTHRRRRRPDLPGRRAPRAATRWRPRPPRRSIKGSRLDPAGIRATSTRSSTTSTFGQPWPAFGMPPAMSPTCPATSSTCPTPCCGPVCCSRSRADSPRQSGGSISEPPADTSRFPNELREFAHRSVTTRSDLAVRECAHVLSQTTPFTMEWTEARPKRDRPRTLKRDLPRVRWCPAQLVVME